MADLLALPLDDRAGPSHGPGESRPGESRPGESRPGESRPGEARPDEARPGADPRRLQAAARRMAGRVSRLLGELGMGDPASVAFLGAFAGDLGREPVDGSVLDLPARGGPEPIDRLVAGLGLDPLDVDLLVLAGLPDEHEGLAAICRQLHPGGRPEATAGLAGALADRGLLGPTGTIVPALQPGGAPGPGWWQATRLDVRHHLVDGPLAGHGALRLESAGPFWDGSLRMGAGLGAALRGEPGTVPGARPLVIPDAPWGLEGWLERPGPRAAQAGLVRRAEVVIVLRSPRPASGSARLAALAAAAGRPALAVRVEPGAGPETWVAVATHALACGRVALFESADPMVDLSGLALAGPVLVSTTGSAEIRAWPRPVLHLELDPLDRHERHRALAGALPELADHPRPVGPATVEPAELAELAVDLRASAALGGPAPTEVDQVVRALDRHPAHGVPAGAVLVHPQARWEDLVLADEPRAQLAEAADRLANPGLVIDQWGFLAGRPGGRGLRLLFCGPPGTGKTLATEVLAASLGRDLLVVDLSRLVSKWVGETEKNLAATFEAAEATGSALLFDEADALFGRRTEVGDARDRYANLETAYLLARIERFEGLVVLATNLRQNLDAAFARRLEFIVTFDPPDAPHRAQLWRRHLPASAPVDPGLDLDDLAARYPLSGGLIRNAAVAAAFLAAAEGVPIAGTHVVHAVRREFAKAGQNFPGPPPDRSGRPDRLVVGAVGAVGTSTAATPSAKEWPCPHPRP